MTLQTTDHGLYLTNPSATAGWQLTQPSPAASLGKFLSTTAVVSGVLGAVFDTVTASQAAAGYTDYRCLAYRNLSATDSALNLQLYIVDPAAGATYSIGLDPEGIENYNSGTAQGTYVATKTTAPSGVTFSTPTSGSPLTVGDVAVGKCLLVWVRRVVAPNTPGTAADLVTLNARAETV